MLQMIRKHLAAARTHDDGATATEYVLLLAGIAAVIVGAVFVFGNFLSSKFTSTQTTISEHSSSKSGGGPHGDRVGASRPCGLRARHPSAGPQVTADQGAN